jgi:hypothetical protein
MPPSQAEPAGELAIAALTTAVTASGCITGNLPLQLASGVRFQMQHLLHGATLSAAAAVQEYILQSRHSKFTTVVCYAASTPSTSIVLAHVMIHHL